MLEDETKGTSIILSELLVGQLNPPQLPDVGLVGVVSSCSFPTFQKQQSYIHTLFSPWWASCGFNLKFFHSFHSYLWHHMCGQQRACLQGEPTLCMMAGLYLWVWVFRTNVNSLSSSEVGQQTESTRSIIFKCDGLLCGRKTNQPKLILAFSWII